MFVCRARMWFGCAYCAYNGGKAYSQYMRTVVRLTTEYMNRVQDANFLEFPCQHECIVGLPFRRGVQQPWKLVPSMAVEEVRGGMSACCGASFSTR